MAELQRISSHELGGAGVKRRKLSRYREQQEQRQRVSYSTAQRMNYKLYKLQTKTKTILNNGWITNKSLLFFKCYFKKLEFYSEDIRE